MAEEALIGRDELRASEVAASLCLATDLAMGFPLEHGLHCTLAAMRLADRLRVDDETAFQTYYGCLLYYVGCTADAEIAAGIFAEGALLKHFQPVIFGAPGEMMRGIARALTDPESPAPMRALQLVRRLPVAARGRRRHIDALCQVSEMMSRRLGMTPPVQGLLGSLAERWDGKGGPSGIAGEAIPLALRIIHVARDAMFQLLLWDEERAAEVIRSRGGGAFDPVVANCLADGFDEIANPAPQSAWRDVLAREPAPWMLLNGEGIDSALAAMGDFADLMSPCFAGHSSGVAELAASAARIRGFSDPLVTAVRRAGFVHDLGRVAVPAGVWLQPGALNSDDWERVRLHPYHSERVLSHSPSLAALARIAGSHHEKLDGSGYHRGTSAPDLAPEARLLAAADAFQARTEPRPYRRAVPAAEVGDLLGSDVATGRLDADSVVAVIAAAGQHAPRLSRPAGLTEREAQVMGLLARGMQTKQVARRLGISAKTADRHIQNSYAKIGVSTRAAAAVYAMQHGLVPWGELPIQKPERRP